MSPMIPKKQSLVLFGNRRGDYYADNSRHLFEWMLAHREDVDPVWVTRSEAVVRQLKQSRLPVARLSSLRGLWLLSRARVAFLTCRLEDIAMDESFIPESLKVIFLTHGSPGVKGIALALRDPKESAMWRRMLGRFHSVTNCAIATSPFMAQLTEKCWGVRAEVTGYPRNDILLSPTEAAKVAWESYLAGARFRRVVLYAPSWRHEREPTRFFPFADFDRAGLFDFLRRHEMLLLLRPHAEDMRRYPEVKSFINDLVSDGGSVRSVSHDVYPDVDTLLPFVDVLISDYSSLYHDFLLLDRPLMFVPYDYEEFSRRNGFMYDYFENLPGPAVQSFRDFCQHLDSLSHGEDPFRNNRQALRDKVHTYKDANSCERVAALLDRVLQEK